MEIVTTIESAAHDVAAAVERPFLTIGARLKAAGQKLAVFFGHPYCPPQLAEGLQELLTIVEDLRQEVSEQGVPCPCKPAPTSATAPEVVQPPAPGVEDAAEPEKAPEVVQPAAPLTIGGEVVDAETFAAFHAFQAKQAAHSAASAAIGGA